MQWIYFLQKVCSRVATNPWADSWHFMLICSIICPWWRQLHPEACWRNSFWINACHSHTQLVLIWLCDFHYRFVSPPQPADIMKFVIQNKIASVSKRICWSLKCNWSCLYIFRFDTMFFMSFIWTTQIHWRLTLHEASPSLHCVPIPNVKYHLVKTVNQPLLKHPWHGAGVLDDHTQSWCKEYSIVQYVYSSCTKD